MNKIFATVVAVVALSTLAASPVRAARLEINDFKAVRFGNDVAKKNPHIYLSAYVKNISSGKITGAKYTFFQIVNNKLVAVHSANVAELAAKGHRDILGFAVPYTTVEQRFELKVYYQNETATAKFTLPAPKTYLTLISLRCRIPNEGNDTAELRVYMPEKEHKFRWQNVNANKTLTINLKKKEMSRDVAVQLWEIDSGSPDDKVGAITIKRDTLGEQTQQLRSKEGIYVLKYLVERE